MRTPRKDDGPPRMDGGLATKEPRTCLRMVTLPRQRTLSLLLLSEDTLDEVESLLQGGEFLTELPYRRVGKSNIGRTTF